MHFVDTRFQVHYIDLSSLQKHSQFPEIRFLQSLLRQVSIEHQLSVAEPFAEIGLVSHNRVNSNLRNVMDFFES